MTISHSLFHGSFYSTKLISQMMSPAPKTKITLSLYLESLEHLITYDSSIGEVLSDEAFCFQNSHTIPT